MANYRDAECSPSQNELIEAFYRYCEESGLSEKKALAKFVGKLGYQESGPKRKMNLKLTLTTELYKKIKTEERNLKTTYLEKEHNPKKALSLAQYIIVEALLSFDCRNEYGRRMPEKHICMYLGYCPRTIENYRKEHRQFLVQEEGSIEYVNFNKLRGILETYAFK